MSIPSAVTTATSFREHRRKYVLSQPEYPAPTTYRIKDRVKAIALTEPTAVDGDAGRTWGVAGDYLVEFSTGNMMICPKALFEQIAEPVVP